MQMQIQGIRHQASRARHQMNNYAKLTKKLSKTLHNTFRLTLHNVQVQRRANCKLQRLQRIHEFHWNKIDWMRCTKSKIHINCARREKRREKFSQSNILTSDSEKCTKNAFMLIENFIYTFNVHCTLLYWFKWCWNPKRNEWIDVLHGIENDIIECMACTKWMWKNETESKLLFNFRKDSTSATNLITYMRR